MKRIAVIASLLVILGAASGCSTLAKRGFAEVVPFSARHRELDGGSANWTSYESFEFGTIRDDVGGAAPADLLSIFTDEASKELVKSKLFRRVGNVGGNGPALRFSGRIIAFDTGELTRAVGFGSEPFLIVRGQFSDAATGQTLSTVNVQAAVRSLRDWKSLVAQGVGKGIVGYLKEKGMTKLPDEEATPVPEGS